MPSSLPIVGLEAIIAGLPGFQSGASAITSAYDTIEKKAQNVGRATNTLGSSFSSLTSPISNLAGNFVNLGQGVLKFGAIAGGAALVGVGALAAGFVALGSTALQEVAKYERMSLSITNLVAREISQGQIVQQQKQVLASLTAKETAELEKLKGGLDNEINDRSILSARIQEQQEKIIQLTGKYGENGLVVIKERAELQGMQLDLSDLDTEIGTHQGRIAELSSKEGQLVTVMEKVRTGQMSMADAMSQASPKAQDLLKWIQLLAIESPFTQESIANSFQTMLAYGFTTDRAKELTIAMVDFTAATGKSEQAANFIALALGQIQARGKLSAQELRQLSEQGVGVNKILEDMGFSLDDVTNGLVPVDQFLQAVIDDMKVFKGAAKDQSTTFAGLIASMEDLKSIGLREFFTGTFDAIKPYLADFVGSLTDAALNTGKLKQIGGVVGTYVAKALKIAAGAATQFKNKIAELMNAFMSGGLFGKASGSFGSAGLLAALGLSTETVGQIEQLFNNITNAVNAFMSGGLFGNQTGGGLLSALGFSPEIQGVIQNVFNTISSGIQTVIGFLAGLSFNEILGGLTGIGAVLATGVFAALVAGLLSLLTPINLIIAGAALLGAAWAGNWGDIQGKTFAAWAVIQPVLQQIWDWLSVNIPIAITTASSFWTTTLQPAMAAVGDWITGTLIPILTNIWNWLSTNLPIAVQTNANIWNNVLLPAFTAVSNFISTTTIPFFKALGNVISAIVNVAITASAGLWQNVLMPAITAVGDYLTSTFGPAFKIIGDYLANTFAPVASNFGNTILPSISNAFNGINTAIQNATTYLNELAGKINTLQLPAWLTPGSPTPFELGLLGIATTISTLLSPAITTVFGSLTTSIQTAQLVFDTLNLSVSNFTLITLLLLQSTSLVVFASILAQLNMVQFSGVFPLDQSLLTMSFVTFPGLQTASIATATSIISMYGQVKSVIVSVTGVVNTLKMAFTTMGSAASSAGTSIKQGMEDASSAIEDLIEVVMEATEEFGKMADAANEAAEAAQAAGSNSGAAGGIGFAAGTPSNAGGLLNLGFKIPEGFPNDSFGPMFAQSGEEMLISPRGTSIEDLILSRLKSIQTPIIDVPSGQVSSSTTNNTTNNYFSMDVTAGSNPQEIIQSFQIMRAMV